MRSMSSDRILRGTDLEDGTIRVRRTETNCIQGLRRLHQKNRRRKGEIPRKALGNYKRLNLGLWY